MSLVHIIEFEEGWDVIQEGIKKLKRILEGQQESFSSEEYMMLYTAPHNYSQQLYDKYKEALDKYINSTVLPALREKHDAEFMLRELVKRWVDHKLMVYQELSGKAVNGVIVLIEKEREGEQIDRALLKNVLDIFVGIGREKMEYYVNDFEDAMLRNTAAYYSRKASCWTVEDSCPDYMLKAEECLKKEKDRVSHYLHVSTETKLLEKVQNELLVVYTNQLLEKERSGFRTLLRDDKVEDLSRMYRLFSRISNGLEPVANMFKQHVTAEGMDLAQQAEDTASTKAESSGSGEQVFVRKLIELMTSIWLMLQAVLLITLFHKALVAAFEIFRSKIVSGNSSAELLYCCDNILKKGESEKISRDS